MFVKKTLTLFMTMNKIYFNKHKDIYLMQIFSREILKQLLVIL